MKIFCHYFNNNYECPYDDQCIFAHDESPVCKFGKECERLMCMFKHNGRRDVSDDEDEVDENSEDESGDENEGDENNLIKITDLEPSLKKV